MTEREVPWLIFDGDCAFCTTTATGLARLLHRPDSPDARLIAYQFLDLAALGTTVERAQHEVLWLTPSGTISGGAQAFARWLRFRGGAYATVGRVMGVPPVSWLAAGVYRLIANNRSKLPGGTPACALPPPGPQPRT